MRSLVAVVRSAELADDIRNFCAASPEIAPEIRVTETALADAPAIINGGADTVLIEAGKADPASLAALEELCIKVSRGGSFIVVMEDPSAEVMRRLFRAGVTDVLATPVSAAELSIALEAARARKPQHAAPAVNHGRIILVMKTAGGVGATTLTANLGAALVDLVDGGVAIADLDIQFGQLSTALDLSPRMDVLDALRAGGRLDPILLDSTMSDHSSGLKVLAAPKEITPLDAIDEHFIERLFSNLRLTAAVTIVETPAAWMQWIGDALDRSDLVIPVAEASVRSAAGAAKINQSFIDFGLTRLNLHLLVNKFEKTIENNDRARKIGEIFRVKPAGAVRNDPKVAQEAADRGLLFSAVSQKSVAVKDFETNARAIASRLGLKMKASAEAPAPFSRIISSKLALRGRTQ